MRTKKTHLWLGIAIVLLILIGYLWLYGPQNVTSNTATQKWCFQKQCFVLEIAKTPEQRSQGLMFREKLERNYGMVFAFPDSGRHPFWMENTTIPLDMIRLDANYKIVDIQQASPCTQDPCNIYSPSAVASYVIELNQGTAKNAGMEIGDMIIPK